MLEKIAAKFSRHLYVIPGGYYIVQLLKGIFGKTHKTSSWATFSFRGISIKVDLSKQMGNAIFWRGSHDWAPIFVLEKHLSKGDTFIDIGANQGEYVLWAARKIGSQGQTIAYEPSDEIFKQLEENVKLNPKFITHSTLRKIGLSKEPGKLTLYTKKGENEGVNTLYPTEDHQIKVGEIELTTLDLEIEKIKPLQINLIKIDVEGAELQVLMGACKTLDTFKPKLLLEINSQGCNSAGYAPGDIIHFLESHGYEIFLIELRGRLKRLDKDQIPEFCNILALPIS